jgi:cyclophilin family peptidyl-prolyl cis-trans isomerase
LEGLEGRRLLTVTVGALLPNITIRNGVSTGTVKFGSTFKSNSIAGTVVQLNTVLGGVTSAIDLSLNNAGAPSVVGDFLKYVRAGAYTNSVFTAGGNFAGVNGADVTTSPAVYLQGGSFTTSSVTGELNAVANIGSVGLSYNAAMPNVSGTVAMVPDPGGTTGSSGFVLNLADNTGNFGASSRYVVFGTVLTGLTTLVGTGGGGIGGGGRGGGIASGGYASLPRTSLSYTVPPFGATTFPDIPVSSVTAGNAFSNLLTISSATVVPSGSLAYSAVASDSRIVTGVTISATGVLTMTYGTTPGTATVTVTATDLAGQQGTSTFTVTNPAPSINVTFAGNAVANGQLARATLGTGFVGQTLGGTLTIRNGGPGELVLGTISAPTGFTLSTPATTNLASGKTVTLSVSVSTSTTGSYSGQVSILNNAVLGGAFAFPVNAVVGNSVILGAGGVKSVSFVDADGTKGTFTVGGDGQGSVTFSGTSLLATTTRGVTTVTGTGVGVSGISLVGTDSTTVLQAVVRAVVKSGGDGLVTVGGVSSAGGVGEVLLSGVALTGTTSFGGSVGQVALGSLGGRLTVVGTLGRLTVAGAIEDATVSVSESVQRIVTGSLISSDVSVGVISAGVPTSGSGFASNVQLGLLTVTSRLADAFSGSSVVAGVVGSLSLGLVTSGGLFSDITAVSVASLSGVGMKAFSVRRITVSNPAAPALLAAGLSSARLAVTVV